MTIDVVDVPNGHLALLVPARPNELSDEQLDSVAGGDIFCGSNISSAATRSQAGR